LSSFISRQQIFPFYGHVSQATETTLFHKGKAPFSNALIRIFDLAQTLDPDKTSLISITLPERFGFQGMSVNLHFWVTGPEIS